MENKLDFQIDTWVVFLPEVAKQFELFTHGVWDKPYLLKIERIEEYKSGASLYFSKEQMIKAGCTYFLLSGDCGNSFKCFRKATKEEIDFGTVFPQKENCIYCWRSKRSF